MNSREYEALLDAANRPGGWGLFKLKTTLKLSNKGYFEREQHPAYGMQWRITDAGRTALQEAQNANERAAGP